VLQVESTPMGIMSLSSNFLKLHSPGGVPMANTTVKDISASYSAFMKSSSNGLGVANNQVQDLRCFTQIWNGGMPASHVAVGSSMCPHYSITLSTSPFTYYIFSIILFTLSSHPYIYIYMYFVTNKIPPLFIWSTSPVV
jgi:hypothetical protein